MPGFRIIQSPPFVCSHHRSWTLMAITLVSIGTSYRFAIMADQSAFKKSEDARIFLGTMVNHVDVLLSAAGTFREKNNPSTPSFSYIVPIIKYGMESGMMLKESLRSP
ncbi:unnamed protein product [Darwinula stevensoni]|uniref:Uncharacterized protein n=1 Tax=Darwinula stevensoni TaxID=69355 RepID=A0A7R9FPZ4_9CRUS|nr:unnamed protein product [Darwinula stevensoni]CAG0898695.1 unnamed protein product [Darwinula stevensoni]